MLTYSNIHINKKGVIFELDDVLFPKKDYVLQVYYLFANLLEYTEAVPPAADLTAFFKKAYEHHGEEGIFERAAEAFSINPSYRKQFDQLHLAARLPLKLLLHNPIRALMQELHRNRKQLFVLAAGNPMMQLNKLKHMEWDGLDQVLKVYFQEELRNRKLEPLPFLLEDNGLQARDVVFIHAGNSRPASVSIDVDCVEACTIGK